MDFEDQLRATGCLLKPTEFRRLLLATFGELYDSDELDDVLASEGEYSGFPEAVKENPGCETVPDEFILSTLCRLLAGPPERLTPTELGEVANHFRDRVIQGDAEFKRRVKFYCDKFGDEVRNNLPEGVTIDEAGEVHIEGRDDNLFNPVIN